MSFVYHIWAHLTSYRPPLFNRPAAPQLLFFHDQFADLPQVSGLAHVPCPDCLTLFASRYDMVDHFHRHHQAFPRDPKVLQCHVCEKDVDDKHGEEHAKDHGPVDVPYVCDSCRWRSSSRRAFIRHFEQAHSATNLLLCPFCMKKFHCKKCASKTRRAFNTGEHYIAHVKSHLRGESHPLCTMRL